MEYVTLWNIHASSVEPYLYTKFDKAISDGGVNLVQEVTHEYDLRQEHKRSSSSIIVVQTEGI